MSGRWTNALRTVFNCGLLTNTTCIMDQISSNGPFSYLKDFKEILLIGAGVGVIPLLSSVYYMATCALWRAQEIENREKIDIKIRLILSMRDINIFNYFFKWLAKLTEEFGDLSGFISIRINFTSPNKIEGIYLDHQTAGFIPELILRDTKNAKHPSLRMIGVPHQRDLGERRKESLESGRLSPARSTNRSHSTLTKMVKGGLYSTKGDGVPLSPLRSPTLYGRSKDKKAAAVLNPGHRAPKSSTEFSKIGNKFVLQDDTMSNGTMDTRNPSCQQLCSPEQSAGVRTTKFATQLNKITRNQCPSTTLAGMVPENEAFKRLDTIKENKFEESWCTNKSPDNLKLSSASALKLSAVSAFNRSLHIKVLKELTKADPYIKKASLGMTNNDDNSEQIVPIPIAEFPVIPTKCESTDDCTDRVSPALQVLSNSSFLRQKAKDDSATHTFVPSRPSFISARVEQTPLDPVDETLEQSSDNIAQKDTPSNNDPKPIPFQPMNDQVQKSSFKILDKLQPMCSAKSIEIDANTATGEVRMKSKKSIFKKTLVVPQEELVRGYSADTDLKVTNIKFSPPKTNKACPEPYEVSPRITTDKKPSPPRVGSLPLHRLEQYHQSIEHSSWFADDDCPSRNENSHQFDEENWFEIDSPNAKDFVSEKAHIGFSEYLTICRGRITDADLVAEIMKHFRLDDKLSVLYPTENKYAKKFCHWGVCGGDAFTKSMLAVKQRDKFMRKMVKDPIVESLS